KSKESQKIWLDSYRKDFEFFTAYQPVNITVDPDFHIPTIRWMPPRLEMLWDFYPNILVIYGSLVESEANKAAAERFNEEFLGLGPEIIKADTDVNAKDLGTKCIVLFGRPETNKITQRFHESFPIKFDNKKFIWQGNTYEQSTQGVAQIIENPLDNQSIIILYAGLCGDATQKICNISEWQSELDGYLLIDLNASYIIYDQYKKLVVGDWEDFNSDLVWNFK
ncbi:MAG TPA: hypothetical protein VMW32_07635, partial [Bacteroidales bacterium]|nr:hypothetical protein [Bacteroidales bacterium]